MAADLRLKALRLRAEGLTYPEIASRLGMGRANAHRTVMKALEDLRGELAEAARDVLQLELERLDELQAGIYEKAKKGSLQDLDRVLAIMARRAKLHGLETDKKELTVTVQSMTDKEMIDEARRLGVSIPPELEKPVTPLLGPAIEDADFVVREPPPEGEAPEAGGDSQGP